MSLEEDLLRRILDKQDKQQEDISKIREVLFNGLTVQINSISNWISKRPVVCPVEREKEELPRRKFLAYLVISIPVFIGGVWAFVDKMIGLVKGTFQ